MSRKIRFYLYMLAILWTGTALQTYLSVAENYYGETIEAVLMEDYYEGCLSEEELKALAEAVFTENKAEPVEYISDDGVFSAYGYTKKIENYVVAGGNRINLNLAASYYEDEDKTRVILASPIYNEDY